MKNPSHFIGFPGVLYIGMAIEILVFAMVGFLGYLAYGDQTADNITLSKIEMKIMHLIIDLMKCL